ncbi:MAG: MerC domain-containing protein [Maricaulaceae bacterium]
MFHSKTLDRGLDSAAMGLANLCLAHCLALPLLAAVLPVFGPLAENEFIHRIFVVLAAPLSLIALLRPPAYGPTWTIGGLIVVGFSLLCAAAFVPALHEVETPVTVLGALVLSAGHGVRWWRCHRSATTPPAGGA